jgi:hypothetical protein
MVLRVVTTYRNTSITKVGALFSPGAHRGTRLHPPFYWKSLRDAKQLTLTNHYNHTRMGPSCLRKIQDEGPRGIEHKTASHAQSCMLIGVSPEGSQSVGARAPPQLRLQEGRVAQGNICCRSHQSWVARPSTSHDATSRLLVIATSTIVVRIITPSRQIAAKRDDRHHGQHATPAGTT